jgi:transcription initiation factor TFIIIB Brf1 subunit/transcription initiation factor TFIIB
MMQSVRVDKKIIEFVRKVKTNQRLAGKTMTMIATEAIYMFCSKPKECFSCSLHRDQLAGIEAGRQSLAQKALSSEADRKFDLGWIKVDKNTASVATVYAKAYGRTLQVVFEQALTEYLTMPGQCGQCQNHKEPPSHG